MGNDNFTALNRTSQPAKTPKTRALRLGNRAARSRISCTSAELATFFASLLFCAIGYWELATYQHFSRGSALT